MPNSLPSFPFGDRIYHRLDAADTKLPRGADSNPQSFSFISTCSSPMKLSLPSAANIEQHLAPAARGSPFPPLPRLRHASKQLSHTNLNTPYVLGRHLRLGAGFSAQCPFVLAAGRAAGASGRARAGARQGRLWATRFASLLWANQHGRHGMDAWT